MPKKTYKGQLPKPNNRGYCRPEIGNKRFNVGNVRDVSRGEMERRLNAVRELFERQCEYHRIEHWAGFVLPYARRLAAGERLVLHVSESARKNTGQASEEAQMIHHLRELGLDIVSDDESTISRGEAELKQLVDEIVQQTLERAIGDIDARLEGLPNSLVDTVRSTPNDLSNIETRSFHNAIDAFRLHRRKTGKRQDNGNPAPSVRNDLDIAKRLKIHIEDFPVWKLQRNKLDELFAYWRNRPVSEKTGKRISRDYSKHCMDTLWAIVIWIDEATEWKWDLPKGAKRIKKTPERLDSDRKKGQSRRVSRKLYTPEQLAVIAENLDVFGKMILGIAVNCAMQPAEFGRLEIDDFYQAHPETNEVADWIIFERPKTFEYGEWPLWPEVSQLVQWGRKRSIALGCERLIVNDKGVPLYHEEWSNPETEIAKWWQAEPSKTDRKLGVVTRLHRDVEGFPRHTIKYLRKILPSLVRKEHGKEVADLVNARRVDGSGRVGGRDTDRYADRLYDNAANAIRELEGYFRPFLNALKFKN